MRNGRIAKSLVLSLLASLGGTGAVAAQADLTQLSLEQLMQVEVTSVSRKEQKLSRTPAAVYIITQEEIRRSGLTTVAELLRLAPGLHVAQINASTWAISARGFNGRFAGKMLVLVDGRSVYTPLFSGVYWEMQDLLLEDIERIEVIRGPGAAMWGANAVNGVINIITKHARQTQGGLVSAGAGNIEDAFGAIRYGGKAGANFHYRFYSKTSQRDHMLTSEGGAGGDGWRSSRTGFRTDWDFTPRDALTVLVDAGGGHYHQVESLPTFGPHQTRLEAYRGEATAGGVLARWSHQHRSGASSALHFYYDRYDRSGGVIAESRGTFDMEYQNRRQFGRRHDFLWGLSFRQSSDSIPSNAYFWLSTPEETVRLYSAFAQDELPLCGDRMLLQFGSRFERNPFSGFEVQPTVRLLFEPATSHSFWTAVSRAVRTPSSGEHHAGSWVATLPASPASSFLPLMLQIAPNPEFRSASVLAIEGGYRGRLATNASVDIAVFRNRYRNLRSQEATAPFFAGNPVPHLVAPLLTVNRGRGETAGVEIVTRWEPRPYWKLAGTYSRFWSDLRLDSGANPATTILAETSQAPAHQASLRSNLDFPGKVRLDTALYLTDRLPQVGGSRFSFPEVPSRLRADIRLSWEVKPELELSVSGQNMLDDRNPEFNPEVWMPRNEIRRGVYGQVRWRF
jgi:iron complex outermembrane receptor protein